MYDPCVGLNANPFREVMGYHVAVIRNSAPGRVRTETAAFVSRREAEAFVSQTRFDWQQMIHEEGETEPLFVIEECSMATLEPRLPKPRTAWSRILEEDF